jgi:cell surface protein SprA
MNNEPIDSFTIWDSYWDIGSPNQHMQQLVINYEIPLIKSHYLALLRLIIPIRVITMAEIIKCIFSVKRYWYSGFRNTVQNARSNNLNTSFNMDMLYKYLGLTKNSNKTNRQRQRKTR